MADSTGNQTSGNGYYIDVKDYYDKIHRTTWARRTAGFLSGAVLASAYAIPIAIAAAHVPFILSCMGVAGFVAGATVAAPTLAMIGTTVGLFVAVASALGMTVNAEVAANAASSAVGFEEKERREKEEQQASGKCVGPDCPSSGSQLTPGEKAPPIFNWKAAAVTVPLFAAFGALIALHPFTSAAIFSHGPFASLAATETASVITSASVFGMFGAVMGLKNSLFSNQLTNFFYKMLTGELFDKTPQPASNLQPRRELVAERGVEKNIDEPARGSDANFASEKLRAQLQAIIEKTEKCCADKGVMGRR